MATLTTLHKHTASNRNISGPIRTKQKLIIEEASNCCQPTKVIAVQFFTPRQIMLRQYDQ